MHIFYYTLDKMITGSEIIQMVTNADLRKKLEDNLEEFKQTKHYKDIETQLTTFANNNTGYDLEAATILALLGYVQELQHHQKQKIAFLLGFQKRVGENSPIKTLSKSELLDRNLLGLIMDSARFNRFNEDQKNLAEDFDAQKILKELDDDLNQKALSLWAQLCYPTVRNTYGKTALIWAAANGYTQTVQALLAVGRDINAETKYGNTALMWAACSGKTEIVETLLAVGTDINAETKYGNTALIWAAVRNGHTEIAAIILEAQARRNCQKIMEAVGNPLSFFSSSNVPNITCCGIRTNWKSAAIAAIAVGAAVGMWSLSQASSHEIDSYAIDL